MPTLANYNEFSEAMNNRFEKTRERYLGKKKLNASTNSEGGGEELGRNFMDYFVGNALLKKVLI